MSDSDATVEEARAQLTVDRRNTLGMIRRMAVSLTTKTSAMWQLAGFLLLDSRTREAFRAETFSGVGFYARPPKGKNTEAVVVFPGGSAESPIIVATRDEDTRKRVAVIEDDETAVFNSVTIIHHKKNGTVEIRTPNGTAIKLPTLADHEALRAAFNAHTHLHPPGPLPPAPTATPTAVLGVIPVPAPTGTQVLKAQ